MPSQTCSAERRRTPRPSALMKALILAAGQQPSAPCLMRDVSAGGAKLEVDNAGDIPSAFWLRIEGDPGLRSCAVMWREAGRLGISFTHNLQKPPLLSRTHFDVRSWLTHRLDSTHRLPTATANAA
jgi:hypothetical protein